MNKYHFSKLERVSKTRAKQLYNNGFSVLFIPCKLNPENNFYNLGIWENIFLQGQYNSFEENELYTPKEFERLANCSSWFEVVEIPKSKIYFCFGARFAA